MNLIVTRNELKHQGAYFTSLSNVLCSEAHLQLVLAKFCTLQIVKPTVISALIQTYDNKVKFYNCLQ